MNPKWYTAGLTQLGVAEIAGPKTNEIIDGYHEVAGFNDLDEDDAWCAAFVAWCMKQAGIDFSGIVAVRAREWLKWGREIKVPKKIDSKYDVPTGAVGVIPRGTGTQGHVFQFSHWANDDHTEFYSLDGNVKNQVIMTKHRTAEVLGWRWPKEVQLPVANQPLPKSGMIQVAGGAVVTGAAAIGGQASEVFDAIGKARTLSTGSTIGLVFSVLVVICVIIVVIQRVGQKKNEKKIGEGLPNSE